MKLNRLCAALFALSACAAEGPGGGTPYQPPYNVGGSGAAGQGTAAGIGASGGGGAAGTAPTAGSGGQAAAGTPGGSAGSSGHQGGAGTMAAAGSGGTTVQGGAGAGGQPSGGGTTGGTPGTVTVEFTTATYGGRYAPLNYGAVWFESSSGTFIKTSKRWAGSIHATDLVTWTAASGGWGSIFGGGNMADMMDAMSSATLRAHQSHTVMWNMKGTDQQVVPDGEYVAVVEMTESRAADRSGPVVRIPFTKGPNPQTVDAPAVETITGVKLRYQP